jgi:hypothetical protein
MLINDIFVMRIYILATCLFFNFLSTSLYLKLFNLLGECMLYLRAVEFELNWAPPADIIMEVAPHFWAILAVSLNTPLEQCCPNTVRLTEQ